MSFLGLSEVSIRRIASNLNVPLAATCALETAVSNIRDAFEPNKFFGEVTRIEPKQPADSALIFCHGLSGNGERWTSFITDKIAPKMPSTRFILPTAPTRRLARDPSTPITAWYDFTITEGERLPNMEDLFLSAAYVRFLAYNESKALGHGENRGKVFFGGFSQGATLSLYALLTNTFPFDGIVALSGYSPRYEAFDGKVFDEAVDSLCKGNGRSSPVFVAHGDADDIIPLGLHNRTVKYLTDNGVQKSDVTAAVYSGLRHSTDETEIADIVRFLQKCQ